jgi:hypothetical protein
MRPHLARAGAAIVAACLALGATALPAAAHEQRTVGAYQFTVGWQHEPTYVGDLNAVQIFVHDAQGKPIDDLGTPPTLQVTISTGSQTSAPLSLNPSFDPDTGLGTHGEFDAPVIPEAVGTYRFHFTGTINGQKIDQTFTSSESTFDDVVTPSAIQFPTKQPALSDLATSVDRLQTRTADALSRAKTAHNDASTATIVAIVALIAGVVLGGAGLAFGIAARRRHA